MVFTYVSGAQLHNDALVQLDNSVPAGGSVILSARMRAPAFHAIHDVLEPAAGRYILLPVSVTIYVE